MAHAAGDHGPQWDIQLELLAQLIEEVSVLAADHRRKKPRQIPRPNAPTKTAAAATVSTADPAQVQKVLDQGGTLQGHRAVAAMFAMKGRVGSPDKARVGDPTGAAP